MRYSGLFGKTIKSAPKDAALISHKLLYQAGFIRESTAGRYYLLPLGIRAHQKIQNIIKEEMDRVGGQEMIAPILHPKYLWEETNRTTSVGFELMSIKDRCETEFVLGGTAEEMLVDLVRKFQISYKDLPFILYQFSTKFRDEMRARGGLLRLREFVMKDGYSFHATEEDFKKWYKIMGDTYTKIFERLGLKTLIVESDNGYIGGEYCHEFVVESPVGESKFFTTDDGSYSVHEEVAQFQRDKKNLDEKEKPIVEVKALRGNTMEDGVRFHNMPLWQQIKSLMMVDEKGNMILAVIRGDLEVNETKLLHLAEAYKLRHATEKEIREIGSEPGFISPVGIHEKAKEAGRRVIVIGDRSLRTVKNAYTGANAWYLDFHNVNVDRDYILDMEGDIALCREGYLSLNGKPLIAKRGIEVGNIFQLGFHYSAKMKDANFTGIDGHEKPYYMGCYGIGLARTMAAIVELSHDDKGIIWPEPVAPYQVHLIGIKKQELRIKEKADEIYKKLKDGGVEVLYDDRENVSVGEQFSDADLIGIPVRLVVSPKTGEKIELKERKSGKMKLLTIQDVLRRFSK